MRALKRWNIAFACILYYYLKSFLENIIFGSLDLKEKYFLFPKILNNYFPKKEKSLEGFKDSMNLDL